MLEVTTGVDKGCQTEAQDGCVFKQQDDGSINDIHEEGKVMRPSKGAVECTEHCCHQL